MLSNYVAGHGCVLIIDHEGNLERIAGDLTASLLQQPAAITFLPESILCDTFSTAQATEVPNVTGEIVLIRVAAFTQLYSLPTLFQLVHRLKLSARCKQVFLWTSERALAHSDGANVVVPYLQHMSGAVLTVRDSVNLTVLTKKPGGAVGRKMFSYEVKERQFAVSEVQKEVRVKVAEEPVNPESLTTFKINFDEEELEARTALKLPYERTSDAPVQSKAEGKIIYHPDSDDDFDEEDPDDDLNI